MNPYGIGKSVHSGPKQTTVVMVVLTSMFTMWDFYYGSYGAGYRVFDLVSFVLLVLTGLLGFVRLREPKEHGSGLVGALGVPLVWVTACLVGIALSPESAWRPALAVMMGSVVYAAFYSARIDVRSFRTALDVLIVLHCAALLLQLLLWYSSSTLVNYHAIVGGSPRLFGPFFRPGGMFLEPSSFSLTIVALIFLRDRLGAGAFGRIDALALCALVLSLSLYGALASAAVLGVRSRQRPVTVVAVLTSVALIVAVGVWVIGDQLAVGVTATLGRIAAFTTDPSVGGRYAGLTGLFSETDFGMSALVGRGVANAYRALGSSGFAFSFDSVGLLGTALWLLLLIVPALPGERLRAFIGVVVLLFAAPMWTTFLWWAWLGLMFAPNRLLNDAALAPDADGSAARQLSRLHVAREGGA